MDSIWGPQKDRAKIDLRMPRDIHSEVHEICVRLGIPKNSFFVLAAGMLLVQLAPMMTAEKDRDVRQMVRLKIQKVLSTIRN